MVSTGSSMRSAALAVRRSRDERWSRRVRSPLLSILVLTTTSCFANAQQSTSATYSDWVLECLNQPGPPAKKTCDIQQLVRVRDNNTTFARVSVEGPTKARAAKLTVQVPVNVSVKGQVEIQPPGSSLPFSAPLDRCLPVGCFAELDLKDDALKKLTSSDGAGKVSFTDATGRVVTFPISLKGFRQAFDALSKE